MSAIYFEFEDGTFGCASAKQLVEKVTGKKMKVCYTIPEFAAPLIFPESGEWTLCSTPTTKCRMKYNCPKDPVCNN